MKKLFIKVTICFLLSTIFYLQKAEAQIVYTDVNPDDTIQDLNLSSIDLTYQLDINNDGVTDFDLHQSYQKTSINSGTLCTYYIINKRCSAYPKNLNAIASDSIGGLSLISPAIIKGGLSWKDTSSNHGYNILAKYSYTSIRHCPPASPPITTTGGNLYNQNDKYLGLKIIKNGSTYYGWVRLQIVSASSITVKDYAFNSVPDQPILAGETSCATPTFNLTQSGSLSFCAGDSVTFTANGTGYQYQWKKNNVNISGATAKTYTAKTAGVYKCKITNSCGSKTSGTRTVNVPCRNSPEGFSETLEKLSVYPNPATNSVTIKIPSDDPGEMQIANLFGQIVFSVKLLSDEMTIDVSKFPEGIYEIRWSSAEKIETKTFSVIK